jgi:glycerol-3-phosphate acyltransferase PlsY
VATDALLILAGYLCGSLPTGVWAARRAGVDVRRSGSGNIGATNVARTAGARSALVTLAGDMAKGGAPVWLSRHIVVDPWIAAAVGVAAIVGHMHSLFLGFSGGKGVATTCGVFLILNPIATLLSAAVFAVAAVTTRYVSVASLSAAVALAVACLFVGFQMPVGVAAWIAAGLVILHHRENFGRLRRGQEPTFSLKR